MEPSPLLRLPPELRNQIFEHVLCNKQIHVRMRPLQPDETGGFAHGSGTTWVAERYKPMYCVCLFSSDWQETYRSSKNEVAGDHALQTRESTNSHRECERVLYDLRWQDFMRMPTCECVTRPCPHFFQMRRSMIAKYGPLPEGLRKAHADTQLDLSLLRTCKTIYNETALLPYSGNTFWFHVPADLNAFLDQVLTATQRDSIQNLQVHIGAISRPTLPATIPRDLKLLQCHMASSTLAIVTDDMRDTLAPWKDQFDEVEIVVGDAGNKSSSEAQAKGRREFAQTLENILKK